MTVSHRIHSVKRRDRATGLDEHSGGISDQAVDLVHRPHDRGEARTVDDLTVDLAGIGSDKIPSGMRIEREVEGLLAP